MNPVSNSKKILFALFFSVIVLFLFQNIKVASSSPSEIPLNVDTEFEMIEYSIKEGLYTSVNTIDLELPSSTWNIDDVELNFTNVEFGIEVKTIEDNPIDILIIDKFHEGYGVQIVIQELTILYGVVIYGNNESSEDKPLYIQIHGYNNITNSPSNLVNGSAILLNMSYSLTPSWHIQTFPAPLNLSKGNYYLVINGSSIGPSPKSKYNWFFNNVDPNYPELNISEYNGLWTAGVQGTPLLYKLIQKVNYTFFPEEVNMTAELNGNSYEISNVDHPGKGYLKKSNLNYHPNKKDVKINIKNNKSENLDFDLSYNLNINNQFIAPSVLQIKSNSSNEWTIYPTIERVSNNYSIKFYYPKSWSSISILKNQLDITADVFFDSINNFLSIPNHTIEDGAEWEIKANSPSINFDLTIISTDWTGGQELYFSIADPRLDGAYKFILVDEEGIEKHQDTIVLPTDSNIFSYEVPSNILQGDYTAYIYWYNQTDAGIQSQVFTLSPSIPSKGSQDFPIFFILGIVLIGGSVIGGSSYVAVKKIHTNRGEKSRLTFEKCSDIVNIEYIIVLDKKSGIDVYSEAFVEKEVDPTLISGFLQAIQNFGSEVLGRAKDSRTFKVEYRKSIILMTEFVNLRLIVILKETPSKNFLYAIESLAYDIYRDYREEFEKFQGILGEFRGIKDLLEHHLSLSFLYPLTVDYSMKMKLTQAEREMVKKALDFMRDNNFNYFHSLYLLPEDACTPKDYETILNLIEKQVFRPIDASSD